ncbi:hypothetical protein KKD52_00350 [Myxococcota bacterium]|nr:hypothetical protein [Myxococcota bacterium]MBU1412652.1 hypothetical protein [Myxococcota bacterium]MBU1508781.1 hypothetical protein [Myxococcota bacterium]
MSELKEKTSSYFSFLYAILILMVVSGCNGGSGKIKGYLASVPDDASNQKSSRSHLLLMDLSKVSVKLKAVDLNQPPDLWPVVQTKQANPDGSFTFDEVDPGRYAMELEQPEFGGAYAIDTTEFSLGDGQTVSLVLPIMTNVGTQGHHSQGNFTLDPASGKIFMASSESVTVLDVDAGTADLLRSDILFSGNEHVPVFLSRTNELLIVTLDRIFKLDLRLFSDPAASEVHNYDDLDFRVQNAEYVKHKIIPMDRKPQDPANPSNYSYGGNISTFLSADGSVLYLSSYNSDPFTPSAPIGGNTYVINTETLEIVRMIPAAVLGYNPVSDQLYMGSPGFMGGVLVVNAQTIVDVAMVTGISGNPLGATPVPGSSNFMIVYGQANSQDVWIPFIVEVNEAGSILRDERAMDYLGISFDPPVGAPSFNESGEFFLIGTSAFRIVAPGVYEAVKVKIPPGPTFYERVSCNNLRAVDPVNLYEIWYGCTDSNRPIALISLDQANIPVGLRVGGGRPLLDWRRGRMFFFTWLNVGIVHYADPTAVLRDPFMDLSSIGAEFYDQGAFCTQSTSCEVMEICKQDTDTAIVGHCMKNQRMPYIKYCAGLGQAACDDGFTCELSNPTNPNSLGTCKGTPSYDFANEGILCPAPTDCPEGLACLSGRCHPVSCVFDEDCAMDQICGMIPYLGRVCLTPGPLPDESLCFASSECANGSCVSEFTVYKKWDDSLGMEPGVRSVCRKTCWQDADCDSDSVCFAPNDSALIMPHCIPKSLAACDCSTVTRCTGGICHCVDSGPAYSCRVGVNFPKQYYECDEINPEDCPILCLTPSQGVPEDWVYWVGDICALSCQRRQDCPWATDCYHGFCLAEQGLFAPGTTRPCNDGAGCGPTQSCSNVVSTYNAPDDFQCFETDSCATLSDCSSATECIGFCTDACSKNSDCGVGMECVERKNWGGNYSPGVYNCMPALCGCQGDSAPDAICRWPEGECRIPQACAPSPCEETQPICNPLNSTGHAGPGCICPSCGWDTWCTTPSLWDPGFTPFVPVPPCPTGYSCQLREFSPLGFSCLCADSSCIQ